MGIFDARVHWSAVLAKVARGTTVILTRRGKPIARLVPEDKTAVSQEVDVDVVAELKRLSKQNTLGGISWKELRDEGRR